MISSSTGEQLASTTKNPLKAGVRCCSVKWLAVKKSQRQRHQPTFTCLKKILTNWFFCPSSFRVVSRKLFWQPRGTSNFFLTKTCNELKLWFEWQARYRLKPMLVLAYCLLGENLGKLFSGSQPSLVGTNRQNNWAHKKLADQITSAGAQCGPGLRKKIKLVLYLIWHVELELALYFLSFGSSLVSSLVSIQNNKRPQY